MSPGRRHFVLSDALPKSQIPHMLGRVVEDKLLPLRSFAPFALGDADKFHHNPEDIIPEILPDPVIFSTRTDFFSQASEWSLGTGLADLISVEQSHSTERGVLVEGGEVKSYSLPNTLQYFQRLMDNESYARDVQALLKRSKSGHAYFVTGFLTVGQGTMTEFRLKSRKSGIEVTVPLLETSGFPSTLLGGLGNPQIKPATSQSQSLGRSMTIVDDVIIAVSYDVIRSSRSLDRDYKGFLKKSIINAGPKRAKPKHLAYGSGSDEDDDSISSDSEVDEGAGRGRTPDNVEITFVDTGLFGNAFDEDSIINAASFRL